MTVANAAAPLAAPQLNTAREVSDQQPFEFHFSHFLHWIFMAFIVAVCCLALLRAQAPSVFAELPAPLVAVFSEPVVTLNTNEVIAP